MYKHISGHSLIAFAIFALVTMSASAESLVDAVKREVNFESFDKSRLDDHLSIVVATAATRHFFSRADVESFHEDAKAKHETYTTSNFKVIQLEETPKSRYASITYSVDINVPNNGEVNSTHMIAHEIWERHLDHWYRLFAAMDN